MRSNPFITEAPRICRLPKTAPARGAQRTGSRARTADRTTGTLPIRLGLESGRRTYYEIFFRFGLILLLTALTAGCNLPQARSLVLPGGAGPQAWIDAPWMECTFHLVSLMTSFST